MKKIIILALAGFALCAGIFFFIRNNKQSSTEKQPQNQIVLEQTYNISKEYIGLRYRTDNVLVNAKSFTDYSAWKNEMADVIQKWEALEDEATNLEKLATEMAEEKIVFDIVSQAHAYDKKEISDVFDNAPAGKKIATLAKHLGVDAKRAFKILQQDQAQVEADGWNEAGDTFQKLETSATVIKDGCKVAGFIGGIAVTGGVSSLATGSSLAQAAVVISGADLTLEIADDGAKIALGNHNKISAIVNDVRKVTEPIATLLTISDIPNNLTKNLDKFNAVMVVLDQFRGAAQEGKIIGIELPAYKKEATSQAVGISVLQKEEIGKWLGEKGINNEVENIEEIKKILDVLNKKEGAENDLNEADNVDNDINEESEQKNSSADKEKNSIVGVWEGILSSTSSQTAKEEKVPIVFNLNSDGTVLTTSEIGHFISWEQRENTIILYAESELKDGQYEFSLAGDTLTFVKLAGPDEDGVWQEIFAGDDFFGGKFLQIELKKQ